MNGVQVSTTINGDVEEFVCHPGETLLDVLRNRLGLTGAKEGCGTGDCGACSVILDGQLVCSCLVLGAEGAGLSRLTRERCDAIVSIPMQGGVSSLNVSAAAALSTYQVTQVRTSADLT